MICKPLALHEQAANDGMTHMAIITADDLTQTTANTAQTITICNLVAGDTVVKVSDNVKTSFKVGGSSPDNAFNSTTRSIGDSANSATYWAAAGEANANGTVVPKRYSSATPFSYTAPDKLTVTFNSMAAKSLSALNTGELHVFFKLFRPDQLSKASSGAAITTK